MITRITVLVYHFLNPYEKIAVLERNKNGNIALPYCKNSVRPDYEKWIEHGLIELWGPPGQRDQRYTPPNDPAFLKRMAEYLYRYGYDIEYEMEIEEV